MVAFGIQVGSSLFQGVAGGCGSGVVGEHIVAGIGWQGNVVGYVLIAVGPQTSVY